MNENNKLYLGLTFDASIAAMVTSSENCRWKVSDQTFPTKTHKTQNKMNYGTIGWLRRVQYLISGLEVYSVVLCQMKLAGRICFHLEPFFDSAGWIQLFHQFECSWPFCNPLLLSWWMERREGANRQTIKGQTIKNAIAGKAKHFKTTGTWWTMGVTKIIHTLNDGRRVTQTWDGKHNERKIEGKEKEGKW